MTQNKSGHVASSTLTLNKSGHVAGSGLTLNKSSHVAGSGLTLNKRDGIPEGGSDIAEGSLAVLLCLGIPGPGNIKERPRCRSEKARRGVSVEKIREVWRSIIVN